MISWNAEKIMDLLAGICGFLTNLFKFLWFMIQTLFVIAIVIFGIIGIIVAIFGLGSHIQQNKIIDKGLGEYKLVDNKSGKTEFFYKTNFVCFHCGSNNVINGSTNIINKEVK